MSEASVDRRCPNGHPVRPAARFCPVCGVELTPVAEWTSDTAAPPDGEPPKTWGRWAAAITVVFLVGALAAGAALLRSDGQETTQQESVISTELEPSTPWPGSEPSEPSMPSAPSVPERRYAGPVDYTTVDDSRAYDVARMFDEYFSGINTGDYPRTRAVIDSRSPINPDDSASWAAFLEGVSTTQDSDITLRYVTDDPSGAGSVAARVTFRSTQLPGYGPRGSEQQTCTLWDVTYTLSEPVAGQFQILATEADHSSC